MHRDYLLQALKAATQGKGHCAPNPAVGACVVKDGEIIATGYHQGPGLPHAEVNALQQAAENAKGSTVYVTLEPCVHHGRTPPCTDALIAHQVAEVVYGFQDPNPQVTGKAAQVLQQAGIMCSQLSLPEIEQFYSSYQRWWQHGLATVTAKLAMSLDGKIAWQDGRPLALTGKLAGEFTHQQRLCHDAILTSAKTVINDDPQLNIRLANKTLAKAVIVLDRDAQVLPQAKLFSTAEKVIIFHGEGADIAALQNAGADCHAFTSCDKQIDLRQVLVRLGELGFHDVWLEAGGALIQAFLQQQLVNKLILYQAPCWIGSAGKAAFSDDFELRDYKQKQWQSLGDDAMCQIDF